MARSRTKNALFNVATSLLSEVVALVCGLILPRLILKNFGSETNGITQSISQFISYISLMKAGISGVASAALYKPLAENNTKEISEVLYEMECFMRKIALIFVIFIIGLSIVYPTFIVKDFGWWYTASLIFIISISTFAEYYFGFTYQTLIAADQKGYIVTSLGILTTILNSIVAVILINNGYSIHITKLGSSLVSLITPLFLYFYVRKKYQIQKVTWEVEDKLPERWDAATHEIASFINNNSDLTILTLFSNMLELSVFTTYRYVTANIKKVVTNATVGFVYAFGDMYARKEYELMEKNLRIFELITYTLTSIIYSVTLVMIVPFVMLYTKNVTDVNYYRPIFAVVLVIASAFNCFEIPYKRVVIGVGRFKDTKKYALIECVVNVSVSVIGVLKFGIIGLPIGTLCAMMIRTFQFASFLSREVLPRSMKHVYLHISLCFINMVLVYFVSRLYMVELSSWVLWVVYAIITTVISLIFTMVINMIFYKEDMKNLFNKLMRTLFRKKANA